MTINATLSEREKTHGFYRNQAACTQQLKNVMHEMPGWKQLEYFQAQSLDAIADKIGRILAGNADFKDHWVDIQGYAALVHRELEMLDLEAAVSSTVIGGMNHDEQQAG